MKKIIFFLFVISIIFLISSRGNKVVIPKESIRFRIIANSNSQEDQKLKWDINKNLVPVISNIMTSSSLESARDNISSNLYKINNIVSEKTDDYKIIYGQNYFPEKKYKGVTYEEGDYESLVITLGDGLGDNWWCVLFPPLCLMEADNDNLDDVTYSTYIGKIINKYF